MVALRAALVLSLLTGCRAAPPVWRQALALDDGLLAGWKTPDSDESFFVGQRGTVIRHDGHGGFCRGAASDAQLWWVWGASRTDVYAGGDGGTLVHWDGARWRAIDPARTGFGGLSIYGIWGASGDDVWLVGGDPLLGTPGRIARGSAAAGFRAVTDGGNDPRFVLLKVWGSSARDVWMVGGPGDAYRFDGAALSHASLLDPRVGRARLVGVSGRGPSDVYAVGGDGNGVVFRYDGLGWTPVYEVEQPPLTGAWTAPGEELFVSGAGALARRLGSDGSWVTEAVPTRLDLHSVLGLGQGRVFAMGAQLAEAGAHTEGGLFFRSSDPLPAVALGVCEALPFEGGPDLAVAAPDLSFVDAAAPGDAARDAGPGIDLARSDAPGRDAAARDAGPPDLAGAAYSTCGPGTECPDPFQCWEVIQFSQNYRCTRPCQQPADCPDFGPNPQCARPGCQALDTTCLPAGVKGC